MGDSLERAYYQLAGDDRTWHEVPVRFLEDERRKKRPAFVTVLTVSEPVDENTVTEKLKYKGPFYLDFDGADIDFVIQKVKQLLTKLESEGCNIDSFGLHATGGKGFHVTIPPACFMDKPPKDGVQNLPAIYREMAHRISVDTLDFRVYSAKRGRMWREPNIKRENGRYKVPVSWAEIKQMDEGKYLEITSTPRRYVQAQEYSPLDPLNVLSPVQAEPNMFLTILYDEARIRVDKAMQARAKSSKKDSKILRKWGGKPPPTFQQMLKGVGLAEGAGFNDVCMQLCILANELGWSEDTLVQEAQGFLENHKGDSNRYRTMKSRVDELRSKFHYLKDNVCYSFGTAPVKALVDFDTPDLDGLTGEEVAEQVEKSATSTDPKTDRDIAVAEIEDDDLSGAIEIRPRGIYVDTEEGKKRISSMHLKEFMLFKNLDGSNCAYNRFEAQVVTDNIPRGLYKGTLDVFQSRPSMTRFVNQFGTVFNGTEGHMQAYYRKLLMTAEKRIDGANTVYMLNKEGLDVVYLKNDPDPELRERFPVWADADHVVLPNRVSEKGVMLRFVGLSSTEGLFKSDMMTAEDLETYRGDEKAIKAIRDFLTCQAPHILGKLIGWYCSTFYRSFFHVVYDKYPLLHVNGTAGAGKTEMNSLMNSFFYVRQQPKILTPGSTAFAIRQHMVASASIPLIIDEYKPADMRKEMQGLLEGALKAAYNGHGIEQGGGNADNKDFKALQSEEYRAPCVFISEQLVNLTALIHRSVVVNLLRPSTKQMPVWRERFENIKDNRRILASIGKHIALKACASKVEDLKPMVEPLMYESETQINFNGDRSKNPDNGTNDRIKHNYGVALFGLMQFSQALADVFGEETFAKEIQLLRDSMFIDTNQTSSESKAEVIKVVDVMSVISRQFDSMDSRSIAQGREYAYTNKGGQAVLEMDVNLAYFKYMQYCATCGDRPLFATPSSFKHALINHHSYVGPVVSEIRQTPACVVLDVGLLEEAGAEILKR